MKKQEANQIVQDDVCFPSEVHDTGIENVQPGRKFWVHWSKTESDQFDVNDFVGWMFESGRTDNYHTEGKGLVEIGDDYHEYDSRRHDYILTGRGTFHYNFEKFFRDCVTDNDYITYKKCQS